MMDKHDDFNMLALGSLNLAHIGWWCGAFGSPTTLAFLFYADASYLIADSCWLLFAPSCVPQQSRSTLLAHHLLVCGCLPIAAGRPVLMRHLLRTWIVEVHSWNHIAIRRLVPAKLISWLSWLNKPLFTALRLIAFPLTYFQYAKERAALTEAIRLAHSPLGLHVGLSGAHLMMYGLMVKWGYQLIWRPWRQELQASSKEEVKPSA